MIRLTYNGADAFLVTEGPDWSTRPEMEIRVPTVRERTLTGREARRRTGSTLRCNLRWTSTLQGPAAIANLRQALQDLTVEPVLVPCWPLALPGAAWGLYPTPSALVIGWKEGWTSYALSPASPEAWDWVAPVLRGWIVIDSTAAAPGVTQVRVSFTEASDADEALSLPGETWTQGPTLPDASAPSVFSFPVQWRERITAGSASIEATRRNIGSHRKSADAIYPQTGERTIEATVTVSTVEQIRRLLRWWQDHAAAAHYVAGFTETARLTADAPAGAQTLSVADITDLGEDRYLALSNPGRLEVARVSALSPGSLSLAGPLTRDWVASQTVVSSAVLARHAGDSLRIEFETLELAQARFAWREVPPEYYLTSGETSGVTLGRTPTTAYLYRLTLDRLGQTEVHRWTSWESDLQAEGATWVSHPIEHSEIRQNLTLDRDEVTVETRWTAAGPWSQFLPGQLDAVVTLAILECQVSGSNGTNVAPLWSGEITGVEFDGPFITATAAGAYRLFDQSVPRFLMQAGCNHVLYGVGCGVSRDAWRFEATVVSKDGSSMTLGSFSRTGGLPGSWGEAGYFALGYAEGTVSGRTRRFPVWNSTALDGMERITVSFGVPVPFAVGSTVYLWPGCDGEWTTCINRFANSSRFGGFPHIPARAPQFTPEKKSESSTGKK